MRWIWNKARAAVLVLLMIMPVSVLAETLVIATGDWPPYVSTQLKYYGVTARIVKEAFEFSGDKVVFHFFPWSRVLKMSERGEMDASFPWSHKPEREQHHLYSDSIGEYGYVFFHLKQTDFDWESMNDLKLFVIGGTNSYNYGEAFLSASKEGIIKVEWVYSDELNWRKLLVKRIDLFPSDIEAGYAKLRELFSNKDVSRVTHHPQPLKPLTSMHLLFPKIKPESKERLRRFNKGIAHLRETGKFDLYLIESREGKYELVGDDIRKSGL
ncbi:substrate-binding periplasmic protein [Zooshikella sp. RANM57]|uniref:substrate-binding periplasmic protein n=1 Tax=Zooshikella sp. RANM57 TaxID=3425863 RepID=UPI003D700F87